MKKVRSPKPEVRSQRPDFRLLPSVIYLLIFDFRSLAVALCVGGCLLSSCAFAQSYTVDWLKVADGSSTSSNGSYTVSGTIGQHDASGSLTGGNYSLTGGFWAIFAVQTPGAPALAVTLVSNTVVVSWSLSATNFVLMQNPDLTVTNGWTPSSYPITTNGGTESITITSPPPGNLFFRLRQ